MVACLNVKQQKANGKQNAARRRHCRFSVSQFD
jgi:hypothetical protein